MYFSTWQIQYDGTDHVNNIGKEKIEADRDGWYYSDTFENLKLKKYNCKSNITKYYLFECYFYIHYVMLFENSLVRHRKLVKNINRLLLPIANRLKSYIDENYEENLKIMVIIYILLLV